MALSFSRCPVHPKSGHQSSMFIMKPYVTPSISHICSQATSPCSQLIMKSMEYMKQLLFFFPEICFSVECCNKGFSISVVKCCASWILAEGSGHGTSESGHNAMKIYKYCW